ncbi:hypothetical protein Tco_0435575 [Tanacetum coccineum]
MWWSMVKKVKALELKLKTRSRKVVMSESDKEEEKEQDVDPLIKLANAALRGLSYAICCSPVLIFSCPPLPKLNCQLFCSAARTQFPAGSVTTLHPPSSPVRIARKGKGVAVEDPTLTHDKTFKQMDERKTARMVELVNTRRKELAEQRAQEQRERPMTPSQLRQYMRTYVKNQIQEEFDKIQRAVTFTRGLKRDGSPMTSASSKKLKTGDDDVNVEAPSHGKAPIEDVEVPSNIALATPHTASTQSLTQEALGKSFSLVTRAYLMTILWPCDDLFIRIKSFQKLSCLWVRSSFLMDSPEVNDGSDIWKNQHTWSIQSWKLYSFSGVHVLETVSGLVLHVFMDKKYPLSVNPIERMFDHQLEICHRTVGNELTTAVQLIAFLKKQISDSSNLEVHDWYVVPTGRVKVPAGRYVVPTGKDNVIVSAGRSKVIPAGRTILVLVVLCLLRFDSIVS